jgi:hypothetical protein
MQRSLLLNKLAHVERHIRDGERHLSHERNIVDELERHGRGNSRTTKLAREVLASFEMSQSLHLNDQVRLLLALAKISHGERLFGGN